MGIKEAYRLGKKYLGGAVKLGKKVIAVYRSVMGKKKVSTEAQDKYSDATELSYRDFEDNFDKPEEPPQKTQPNIPRELETAKGIIGIVNKAKGVKELAKLANVRNIEDAKAIRAKAERIMKKPTKKSAKLASIDQKAIQVALNIGGMSKKEFKKYQKEQERKARRRKS